MTKRRQPSTLLAVLVMLAAPACASMQQRVAESENRSVTLEAQVADLQATQQSIITRLTELSEDIEAALDPVRVQQADGGADLRALQAHVTSLQQQVELLTDQLAAATSAAASEPAADPGVAMPPAGGSATDAAPGTSTARTPSDLDELFNSAYADYTAGHYIVAIGGFEEVLSRYPDSFRAADAVYWIGESLAAQDLHDDARERFLEVAQRFPDASKVPDATLRAALEAIELGLSDDASQEIRELIQAFEGSDAALIGCMQLGQMGEQLPDGCRSSL